MSRSKISKIDIGGSSHGVKDSSHGVKDTSRYSKSSNSAERVKLNLDETLKRDLVSSYSQDQQRKLVQYNLRRQKFDRMKVPKLVPMVKCIDGVKFLHKNKKFQPLESLHDMADVVSYESDSAKSYAVEEEQEVDLDLEAEFPIEFDELEWQQDENLEEEEEDMLEEFSDHFVQGNELEVGVMKEELEIEEEVEAEEEYEAMSETSLPGQDKPAAPVDRRNLMFNYCNRGTIMPFFERIGIPAQTDKMTVSDLGYQINAHLIYNAYEQNEKNQHDQALNDTTKKPVGKKGHKKATEDSQQVKDLFNEFNMLKVANRFVYQRINWETTKDYFHFVNPYDKRGETFLPLWKTNVPAELPKDDMWQITYLRWHPFYNDLYGVSYTSLKRFVDQNGYLFLFSLKDMRSPEFYYSFESAVTSFHFHPEIKHKAFTLLALLSGHIIILKFPWPAIVYQTDSSNQHTLKITQVQWIESRGEEREMAFISAGLDGFLYIWVTNNRHLERIKTLDLRLVKFPKELAPKSMAAIGVTCFALHPTENMLLIGLTFGIIVKHNLAYPPNYIYGAFQAHVGTMTQICINKYNPDVFLTCSENGNVVLWKNNVKEPLNKYSFNSPVNSVEWLPHSSTVFGVITHDTILRIFNLNTDLEHPVFDKHVLERGCCQQVAFHLKDPLVMVGDNFGCIHSFKLSPNIIQKRKSSGDEGDTTMGAGEGIVNNDAALEELKYQTEKLARVMKKFDFIE